MKWHASLIKPSQLDWSETNLCDQGRNSVAGIRVIIRKEYGLAAMQLLRSWSYV
jgi:hypothetical protein